MDDVFKVKGNPFYKKTFYSTLFSTNIAVYRHLAETVFDGDLNRIVWASNERTFRKRQEQVTKRNDAFIGTLDLPYCSFRLAQDGIEGKAQNRQWFNQALNVEGEWTEELGRKVRLTPAQLRYEGVVCLQHDTDVYWLQQLLLWQSSNEIILKPTLETTGDDGKPREIQNIAILTLTPHMNTRFSEVDWMQNNKIQAIDMDIQIDTYLLMDNRAGYWLTKSSMLKFAEDTLPQFGVRRNKDGTTEDLGVIDNSALENEDLEEIIKTEIFNDS